MNNLIATIEKEIIRNEILKICQEAVPAGASIQVLQAGLKKMGIVCTAAELEQQVRYLVSKQLVTADEINNARLGINRMIVSITAAGMDVLDGNQDTVGIANS